MCWRRTNKTEKAKGEQGKEDNSPKIQYKSLAPKEDLGDSEYFEALKFALQDSSVHNIAVAGKYGSGKSSVIGSFLAQYGKTTQIGENPLKSITIALAGDKKDKREDSLIEYEILEHLFFSADESELPDSQFSRIKEHTERTIAKYVTWTVLIILFTYLFINGEQYFEALNCQNAWIYVKGGIGCFILLFLALAFRKFIPRLVSLSLRKISVGYADMKLDSEVQKSVLNQHIDEIIYYFKKTKTNLVVFEDLDRFDNASIFVKLREINQILNNSNTINGRIVFVYALRDDLFDGLNRTKFFDFIIPVIPYTNSHNGAEILSRELAACQIKEDALFDLISYHANDTRLVYNIINEYRLYSSLKSNEANFVAKEMLAIVAYKNIFPIDFEDLLNHKGNLHKALHSKDDLKKQKQDEIQKRIKDLDTRIKRVKEIGLLNLRAVRLQYIHHLKETLRNPNFLRFGMDNTEYAIESLLSDENFPMVQNSKLNKYIAYRNGYSYQEEKPLRYKFSDIEKIVDPNQTYAEKEAAIKDQGAIEKLIAMRTMEENEQKLLEHKSIKELLSNGTEVLKAILLPTKEEQENSDKKVQVGYIATMLSDGYIDEAYEEYLSIFQEGRWTRNDYANYMKIINGDVVDAEYAYQNRAFVLGRLEDRYFETNRVYNYSIMDELFESGTYPKREASVINTFGEDTYAYWLAYATREDYSGKAFAKLCSLWPNIWKDLSNYANEQEKNVLLKRILYHADIDNVGIILGDDIHRIERIDTLFLSNIPDKRLLAIALKNNLHFEYLSEKTPAKVLDYLYDQNLYAINPEMLQLVAQEHYQEEAFTGNNYTWMHECGLQKMCDYVDANIQTYVEQVWLYLSTHYEKPQYLVKLLRNEHLSLDDKKQIVSNYKEHDIDISELAEQKELCVEIWRQEKMKPSWENVFISYNQVGDATIRPELASYINTELAYTELSKSPFISKREVASGEQIRLMTAELLKCKYIKADVWKRFLNVLPGYAEIPDGAIDELVEVVVQGGKLGLSTSNYYQLKANYAGLHLLFLNVHFKKLLSMLLAEKEFVFDAEDVSMLPNYVSSVKRQQKLLPYIPQNSIIKAKNPEWLFALNNLSQEQYEILLKHTGIDVQVRIKAFCFNPVSDISKINEFVRSLGDPYNKMESQANCALPKNDVTTPFVEKLKELGYIVTISTHYKRGKERYRVYMKQG